MDPQELDKHWIDTHLLDTQELDTQEVRAAHSQLVTIGAHTPPSAKAPHGWVDESDQYPTVPDIPIVHEAAPLPTAAPVRPGSAEPAPGTTSRSPKQQQQQNQRYAEILQEIRVAQTGVQFLLGFLMTLSFTPRFTGLTAHQRDIYVVSLILAFAAAALLTAPAPFHRLVTRRGLKRRLVEISSRLALAGLSLLLLAMNSALLLVLDVVLGFRGAALICGIALSGFLGLWFGMPLWQRITHHNAP